MAGKKSDGGDLLNDDDNYCHASSFVVVVDRCLSWCVVWATAAGCGVSSVKKGLGGC